MNRRLLLLLGVFWNALAGFGWAGQTLIIGSIGTSASQQEITAKALSEALQQNLPGTFHVEIKGGSSMGGESDVWDALLLGSIDVAILTTASITAVEPHIGVLSLPFLFRDAAHADHVLDGPIGQELGRNFKSRQIIFLAFAEQGFRHLTNSKHPVLTPQDLAGLKIRVIPSPIYETTFAAFGATAVPMAWPRVYSALRESRVDGQENPLMVINTSQFYEVQKYLSLTGHFYSAMVLLVNADRFQGLEPKAQEALQQAARQAGLASRQSIRTLNQELVAKFKQMGMQVSESIDREAFIKTLDRQWSIWEKQFGADLIRRIRETP